LCVSINNIIIPNIGTLALVNIPFGMHLTHIYCFNQFFVMVIVPFRMYLAPHVLVRTLAMAYIFLKCVALVMVYVSFEMCLALAMAYIPIGMCLALTKVYILVRMCLALCAPFQTLTMTYVFIKMCLTLAMTYVSIKMCLTLAIDYILIKMHLVLAMAYIVIRMCLARHILFRTLIMAYDFIETHIILVLAYIPLEMHSAPTMINNDAFLSPLLDPLEGPSTLNYGKLGLEGRSRLQTLKMGRGAC